MYLVTGGEGVREGGKKINKGGDDKRPADGKERID